MCKGPQRPQTRRANAAPTMIAPASETSLTLGCSRQTATVTSSSAAPSSQGPCSAPLMAAVAIATSENAETGNLAGTFASKRPAQTRKPRVVRRLQSGPRGIEPLPEEVDRNRDSPERRDGHRASVEVEPVGLRWRT